MSKILLMPPQNHKQKIAYFYLYADDFSLLLAMVTGERPRNRR